MFVVDTNVLVYVADVSAPEHPRCRALLDRWRVPHGAWCLTGGNGYEFLRVVTRPRVLRKPSRGPAAGGMATVYLAHDLEPEREVAIEVLGSGAANGLLY